MVAFFKNSAIFRCEFSGSCSNDVRRDVRIRCSGKEYSICLLNIWETEEEASKLTQNDDLKSKAIELAENNGIVFIDEIDKICQEGQDRGVVSRQGVQRDLLPLIEGSAVNTKYGMIKTDHVLFIASGAFQMSKPSDLIPELQGRLPIRVELNPLSADDFEKILKEPHNSLTKQYQMLLSTENVDIKFEDSAIKRIAEDAFKVNEKTENI